MLDIDLLLGIAGGSQFVKGIIEWNRKNYGITNITPTNLGVTTGVHSGIMPALRAFAPPGSKVLMVTPIYNAFDFDLYGSKLVANESVMKVVNGQYEIDWADFEKRASDPMTKTTILCNPHNPVGRVWTKAELQRYGEICTKHNVKILSDEIHCDFVGKGQKYTPFANLEDKKIVDNSITFKAASKTFSLAGLKCAWFFATDPATFKAVQFWNRSEVHPGHRLVGSGVCGRRKLEIPVRRLHRRQPAIRQRLHQEEHSLDQSRQQAARHLSGLVGCFAPGRKDRRQGDGGCGKQEDAADQPAHRQAQRCRLR